MPDLARFLDIVNQLKALRRAGWVRCGVADAESVADHTWGVALLSLLYAPPELDRSRLLALATIHDLAEAIVGDITPHDSIALEEKQLRERTAMEQLSALAANLELLELWNEYDSNSTPEARFAHELDALEMASQAVSYQRSGQLSTAAAQQFIVTARNRLQSPHLRKLLDELTSV